MYQSHNTVRYRTVRYSTASFVRPQRLRISNTVLPYRREQKDCSGFLRLSKKLAVSRLELVMAVLFRSCFLRVRDRYFSICWGICRIRYAAMVNNLWKCNLEFFLLDLHFYISQVCVACGGGRRCEFDAAATAKVEIWRGPSVVLRFLRLYHWKPL